MLEGLEQRREKAQEYLIPLDAKCCVNQLSQAQRLIVLLCIGAAAIQ